MPCGGLNTSRGAGSSFSCCWVAVVVKIVLWYRSVLYCNLLVTVVSSSRTRLHLLHHLMLGGWRQQGGPSSWTNTPPADSITCSIPKGCSRNIHRPLICLNWVPLVMKMHWYELQPGWCSGPCWCVFQLRYHGLCYLLLCFGGWHIKAASDMLIQVVIMFPERNTDVPFVPARGTPSPPCKSQIFSSRQKDKMFQLVINNSCRGGFKK